MLFRFDLSIERRGSYVRHLPRIVDHVEVLLRRTSDFFSAVPVGFASTTVSRLEPFGPRIDPPRSSSQLLPGPGTAIFGC
jgi:hypothetical protein